MTAGDDTRANESILGEEVADHKNEESTKVFEESTQSVDQKTTPINDVVEQNPIEEKAEERKYLKSASFREESNLLSDLSEVETKALNELKSMLEDAILKKELLIDPSVAKTAAEEDKKAEVQVADKGETEAASEKKDGTGNTQVLIMDENLSLWGVPLMPSKNLDSTNVILLKFLRAREFKVDEALEMLKSTIRWRKESKIDSILEESLGSCGLDSAAFMDGVDREGHPVCYNIYGVFEDKDLYQRAFGSEEKCEEFFRWRLQVMEKGIQQLNLEPGSVSSILQIIDLKNSPGPSRKEMRNALRTAVNLLQDNYPEFVSRNILINVPFWYYAFKLTPFLTQRTKSKFIFARPSRVTETLLKYISAENIPIKYGGLKHENDEVFGGAQCEVLDIAIKAGSTESAEIPAPEVGATIIWDLTVVGWEVNYKEEFVPDDEGSYTILIQKSKRISSSNMEPVRNSFQVTEPGKVVLSIENNSYWKKRALYRFKVHTA